MSKSKITLAERLLDAETRSSIWLANGNEYAEKGKKRMAEICYDKSQYWLDRYNRLKVQSDSEEYRRRKRE